MSHNLPQGWIGWGCRPSNFILFELMPYILDPTQGHGQGNSLNPPKEARKTSTLNVTGIGLRVGIGRGGLDPLNTGPLSKPPCGKHERYTPQPLSFTPKIFTPKIIVRLKYIEYGVYGDLIMEIPKATFYLF